MKKILLIAYAYPPISSPGAVRAEKMVKYLKTLGWNTHVLTVKNGYSKRIGGLADPLEDTPENVTRYPDPIATFNTQITKADNQQVNLKKPRSSSLKSLGKKLLFPDRAILWAQKAKSYNPDMHSFEFVYSSSPSPSSHFVAYNISKSLGVPWIAEFRDPMSWLDKNAPVSKLRRIGMAKYEAWVAKKADALVVVSDTFADYFTTLYPSARIISIPNGAEFTETEIIEAQSKRADRVKVAGEPFRLVHTGSLYGGARPPHSILKACQKVMTETNLKFECLFAGNDAHLAIEAAKELGIGVNGKESFVKNLGPLPRDETLDLLKSADAAISLLHRDELGKISIMSKFLDYLPTAVPILNLGGDDYILSKIITDQKAGASFEYDDIEGIASWLKALPQIKQVDSLTLCKNWSAERMAESMDKFFRYMSKEQ